MYSRGVPRMMSFVRVTDFNVNLFCLTNRQTPRLTDQHSLLSGPKGSLERPECHHHGGEIQGRGEERNNWRGVEEDIQDPGPVPPDHLQPGLSHHHSLVYLRLTPLSGP